MIQRVKNRKLGDIMVELGALEPQLLQDALSAAQQSSTRIGQWLLQQGHITGADIRDALAEQYGLPVLGQLDGADLRSENLPRSYPPWCALGWREGKLLVATSDPGDLPGLDRLYSQLSAAVSLQVCIASQSELGALRDEPIAVLSDEQLRQQVMQCLTDAVRHNASDWHLQPELGALRLRLRVDGVLRSYARFAYPLGHRFIESAKVLLGLDLGRGSMPQDAHTHIEVDGRGIDCRVAMMPTFYGDAVVVRLFDRERTDLRLDDLGLNPQVLPLLRQLAVQPAGLVLFSGPTGSGKTTTLYALMAQMQREARCLISLEDPVEYRLSGCRQTGIDQVPELDFAKGLRAVLRQDPDVILLGEIRDGETAEIALQAALTGHLVLASVHVSGIAQLAPRLSALGVAWEAVTPALLAVVGQRLLRRYCQQCMGQGCMRCRHSGFAGRFPVLEMAQISPDSQALHWVHQYQDDIHWAVQAQMTAALEVERVIGEGVVAYAVV